MSGFAALLFGGILLLVLGPPLFTDDADAERLGYFGRDYEGELCGQIGRRDLRDRPFVYFLQPHNLSSAVCVRACPLLADELACDYAFEAAPTATKRGVLGRRCFAAHRTRAHSLACLPVDPALAATADDFVRDRLLAPALDAAAANVAVTQPKRRPSVFQTDDGADDGPPPAFYDVVRAARVAATSWRGRLAVLAPRLETSDAAAAAAARALDAAAQRTADGLGEALGRARQSGDYAMRDEPSVLKPTKATVAFRDALLQRAAAADHAFAAHDDLLATWRKSLAAHASRAVEAHLTSVKVSRAGAFVLARDLDEIRKGAAPLGSNEADARFSRLREGVGVFELDAEQLAYVALKPGGAFASLPRDELVRRILRRADAWNFRGKRAKWVEELVASLEAS